tara:strand:+ start:653 stop:1624 length:972 start_codon:yes stop_codon:yes gene_type:complete
MPLTAKVVPGETFPDNENVTRAKLRNAANPSVTIENSLSNSEVAANAGVQLSKMEGVAAGALLVGSASTANAANGSLKAIEAVTLPSEGNNIGGGVSSTTGITPSNNTVDHDSLRKSQSENVVRGARDMGKCTIDGVVDSTKRYISTCEAAGGTWAQEDVAANDHLLICNVSADANSEENGDVHDSLRRVSVENLLKSTFTTQVALTDLTSGSLVDENTTKTVNLDGNPVQAIACKNPSSSEYTLTIKFSNLPDSGFAKNIMLVVFNLTSTNSVKLNFEAPDNGKIRFIGSTPPARLGAGKAGVMAVTGWPNSNVLIGYSAEV